MTSVQRPTGMRGWQGDKAEPLLNARKRAKGCQVHRRVSIPLDSDKRPDYGLTHTAHRGHAANCSEPPLRLCKSRLHNTAKWVACLISPSRSCGALVQPGKHPVAGQVVTKTSNTPRPTQEHLDILNFLPRTGVYPCVN